MEIKLIYVEFCHHKTKKKSTISGLEQVTRTGPDAGGRCFGWDLVQDYFEVEINNKLGFIFCVNFLILLIFERLFQVTLTKN